MPKFTIDPSLTWTSFGRGEIVIEIGGKLQGDVMAAGAHAFKSKMPARITEDGSLIIESDHDMRQAFPYPPDRCPHVWDRRTRCR